MAAAATNGAGIIGAALRLGNCASCMQRLTISKQVTAAGAKLGYFWRRLGTVTGAAGAAGIPVARRFTVPRCPSGLKIRANPKLLRAGLLVLTLETSACERYDPDVVAGEEVFGRACMTCHTQGINNAPVIGNKEVWADRIELGYDTLAERAAKGFGTMPARGGYPGLSDEEVGQAVKYMLAQIQKAD